MYCGINIMCMYLLIYLVVIASQAMVLLFATANTTIAFFVYQKYLHLCVCLLRREKSMYCLPNILYSVNTMI